MMMQVDSARIGISTLTKEKPAVSCAENSTGRAVEKMATG